MNCKLYYFIARFSLLERISEGRFFCKDPSQNNYEQIYIKYDTGMSFTLDLLWFLEITHHRMKVSECGTSPEPDHQSRRVTLLLRTIISNSLLRSTHITLIESLAYHWWLDWQISNKLKRKNWWTLVSFLAKNYYCRFWKCFSNFFWFSRKK